MKKYHFLVGAPRSGNTVVASVLNQNNKICLTAQSPLCSILYELDKLQNETHIGKVITNFPDYQSYNNIIKSLFDSYYSEWEQEIIFDRSPWGNPAHLNLLKKYFDFEYKFLILRRSLVEIFASFMKWCEENPNNYINEATNGGTVDEKFDYLFHSEGHLSKYMRSIVDIRNSTYFYHEIFYDEFVNNPKETIEKFYSAFGIDNYDHDFNNISQLKLNGVKYDDTLCGNNMHKLRSVLKKSIYDIERYVPPHLIKKMEELERIAFPLGYK